MIKERGRQDTKIKNSLSVGIVRQTEKHEVEIYIFQKNMYRLLCFCFFFGFKFKKKKKVKLIIAAHHGIAWNIHKKIISDTQTHKYL